LDNPLKLEEESSVLSFSLSFLYRDVVLPEIILLQPNLLFPCARFADKYQLAQVTKNLRSLVVSKPILENEPLRAYAICVHFGWKEEEQIAMEACLKIDLQAITPPPDLNYLSGADLQKLHNEYAKAREESLRIVAEFFTAGHGFCDKCRSNMSWKRKLLAEFQRRLLKVAKLDPAFEEYTLFDIVAKSNCHSCLRNMEGNRQPLDKLQKALAKVGATGVANAESGGY
jgi:hypothetical protein